MENGLIDADLGGFLYKKRVARPGGGKSGGYRTLLSARLGNRYVFLHGFPKSDKANVTTQVPPPPRDQPPATRSAAEAVNPGRSG